MSKGACLSKVQADCLIVHRAYQLVDDVVGTLICGAGLAFSHVDHVKNGDPCLGSSRASPVFEERGAIVHNYR